MLSGATAAFEGGLVLSGGTAELANAAGAGGGAIVWGSTTTATLRIDAADSPAAGSTFSSTLSNFDREYDLLDLKGIAFVSGATAILGGATLALTDGGSTYDFNLAGTAAATYGVTSDGAGGTLIKASTTHTVPAAATRTLFVQAMASFATREAPEAGHSTTATLATTPILTPVGSATASGAAWHGG